MKLEPIAAAPQTGGSDATARRRRILANVSALLVLAGASGVLAPLLVETDGFDGLSWVFRAAPSGAEQAAGAPVFGRALDGRERQLIDTLGRDLASAREEITSLEARLAAEMAERGKAHAAQQAAEAAAGEHKQALERERKRADILETDLNAAYAELQELRAPAYVVRNPILVRTTPVSAETQRTQADKSKLSAR